MHTIQECSQLWVLFEERVDYIPPFLEMRRHTNSLLKTCNELLRRLSKSNDPVSYGRILMFLAYVFPLSDKSGNESLYQIVMVAHSFSGLNMKSESNIANVTIFEAHPELEEPSKEKEKEIEKEAGEKEKEQDKETEKDKGKEKEKEKEKGKEKEKENGEKETKGSNSKRGGFHTYTMTQLTHTLFSHIRSEHRC